MRAELPSSVHHQRLFAATALWLLAGCLALVTTLIPLHTALLGWTPVFWLLAAPLIVLLALEPRLVQRLLVRRRRQHLPAVHGVIWQQESVGLRRRPGACVPSAAGTPA